MNYRSLRRALVPDLREQVRQATANAILAAAEEVFAADGMHGAHMGEIARRAGLAVGTLYNHFRDRETLLLALVQANCQELFHNMDEALDKKLPFLEQLSEVVATVLNHFEKHRRFFRLMLLSDLGYLKVKLMKKGVGAPDLMSEMKRRFDTLMKRGAKEKVLRPDTEEQFSMFLSGMIRSVAMYDAVSPREGLLAKVDDVMRFFLHGAATETPAAAR